jgi:hypothetical protein
MKFSDVSLPSPRNASPCLARKWTLDKISRIPLACTLLARCAWLSSSLTSFVVAGKVTTTSTASAWHFDCRYFLKDPVASFQFEYPLVTYILSSKLTFLGACAIFCYFTDILSLMSVFEIVCLCVLVFCILMVVQHVWEMIIYIYKVVNVWTYYNIMLRTYIRRF